MSAPAATEAEKTAAIQAWSVCVRAAAKRYDDRKSDVMSIAAALQSMCHPEYVQTIEAYGRGMNPRAQEIFADKAARSERQQTASIVLVQRQGDASARN
jgi:hypothetical protein